MDYSLFRLDVKWKTRSRPARRPGLSLARGADFLLVVVLAPVIEETVFRGWIQRSLERFWGPAPAVVVTAALFALMHGIPEYMPYYFGMGVLFGGIVLVTRSLWGSILLHAAYNFQSFAIATAFPTTLEEDVAFAQQAPLPVLSVVVLAGAAFLLVGNVRRVRAALLPSRARRLADGVGDQPSEATV